MPVTLTIPALLDDAATRFGDAEAIVGPDGRITYARLAGESRTIARSLIAAGIRPGDHVGICAGNGIEWAALFHGIARAGAVCVPINTRLKPDEIRYQLAQGDVRLLFLADRLLNVDFLELFAALARGMSAGFPQL